MKPYAARLKSIAALLMLIALLSLLLPCAKISSNGHHANVSGVDVLTTSVRIAYKHFRDGAVPADYTIKGDLKWGDLTGGVSTLKSHGQLRNAEIVLILLLMPAVLCFFAMFFTFSAIGKKTMFLPTVLLSLVVAEAFFITISLSEIISSILQYGNTQGLSTSVSFTVSLSIGCNLFLLLNVIALMIILFLWITGGFNKPDQDSNRSNTDSDDEDSGRRKKKKSRRRRSRRKKTKRKTKKEKEPAKQKKQEQDNKKQKSQQVLSLGMIEGVGGFYQGISKQLAAVPGNKITLGTTARAMLELQRDSMSDYEDIEFHNVVVLYDTYQQIYRVTSHAHGEVKLMNINQGTSKVLRRDETVTASAGTILTTVAGDAAIILK